MHPNPNVSLSLSGIVEVPAYILCYYMMENPKLGRRKSTTIFYAGTCVACGMTVIAFWTQTTTTGGSSILVLALALFGKLSIGLLFFFIKYHINFNYILTVKVLTVKV